LKKLNREKLQQALALVSKEISVAQDNVTLNNIAEELVTSLLDAEFSSLWYYDETKMILLRERDNGDVRELSLEEKKGIIYKCFMSKKAGIYNYLASDKDYVAAIDNPDNIKIKSKILLPLLDGQKLVGIVTAYSSIKKIKKFTKYDMEVLEVLTPVLIDILYKMHKCSDASCACNKSDSPNKITKQTLQNFQEVEALHQKEESADETLGVMANFIHDIRTPANTLQGFLELLELQINDKRLQEYITNAKNSAFFINELTTSMLDRISLHHEQKKQELSSVDTVAFFASIAEMFVSNMYTKKIAFNIYIDPLLPKSIKCDELKLKRVLINLIGNAYKFTPSHKEIEFSVVYNKKAQSVSISVKDRGIGIPKEKQSEIFEAFKQAEDTTALNFGGTGLGLTICSEYVRELGGELFLESEVDKGTSFSFALPLDITQKEPTLPPLALQKQKIIILCSKENEFSTNNIVRYLKRMGIEEKNIERLDSLEDNGENIENLICYQHKIDKETEDILMKLPKALIVEEELFSINSEDLPQSCDLFFEYRYFGDKLYAFIDEEEMPKVLIVDDDKTSVSLLKHTLESEYCDIDIATNGKMALEMIIDSHKRQKPYTVVYIDNNMPVMTGIEVMQKTREFERDNNLIPLYAVSTSGDYVDTRKVNVFNEYIGKPFRVDDIRRVLHH
jgi:CheY-like chemotaxis protein/nitrogen-specific signal transduction histidine kinase